jgi:hypothetical protein
LGAGESEVVGVAAVEDVEAAIGENQRLPFGVETIPLGAHSGGIENTGEEFRERLPGVHAT